MFNSITRLLVLSGVIKGHGWIRYSQEASELDRNDHGKDSRTVAPNSRRNNEVKRIALLSSKS